MSKIKRYREQLAGGCWQCVEWQYRRREQIVWVVTCVRNDHRLIAKRPSRSRAWHAAARLAATLVT
jgi:hypothetical protein